MMSKITGPVELPVNVTEVPVGDEMIVPFWIDQEYVAPASTFMIVAVRSEPGQTGAESRSCAGGGAGQMYVKPPGTVTDPPAYVSVTGTAPVACAGTVALIVI